MAGDGATYKGGIKAYWKRRGYGRLDPASSAQRRPRLPTAELGDGSARGAGQKQPAGRRPWRGWRVRRRGLGRRILRALSPRRLLARLRDAYVRGMLRLACSAAVAGGGSALYGPDPFARPRPLKEYDEKALVEIYRSILARGGGGVVPVAGDAAAVVAVARLPTVA